MQLKKLWAYTRQLFHCANFDPIHRPTLGSYEDNVIYIGCLCGKEFYRDGKGAPIWAQAVQCTNPNCRWFGPVEDLEPADDSDGNVCCPNCEKVVQAK